MNSAVYAGLWLLVAQGGAVSAPPEGDPRVEPAPAAAAPGRYQGVLVPEADARNPLPQPRNDPPRLIWTGFKMAGERSEIFLQTTRPVVHELAPSNGKGKRPGSLSVLLRDCRIHLRNNARRIDTRFFATPVQGVSARQRKRDVQLDIALKDEALPEVRVQPGPEGTQFVVLSFGPGKAETAAPTVPAPVSP